MSWYAAEQQNAWDFCLQLFSAVTQSDSLALHIMPCSKARLASFELSLVRFRDTTKPPYKPINDVLLVSNTLVEKRFLT